MSKKPDVGGNISVQAPSLAELKTRQCSLQELQAAVVKLIELHNAQNQALQQRLPSSQEAAMASAYGL